MNKIRFLKFIDKVVGKSLIFLLPKAIEAHADILKIIRTILIIRPGGIGDAVLLLPAINSLRKNLPDTKIDILCEKRNFAVFAMSSNVNKIYLYDRKFSLFKCLVNRYDIVIDTEQWHRLSAVVASLSGAPMRIGFATNERQRLFTHKVPYSHDDYEVLSFLSLINTVTGGMSRWNPNVPFISILLMEQDWAEGALKCLKDKNPIVAIFPGATVQERLWGTERFRELAVRLISNSMSVVVIGGNDERSAGDYIHSDEARILNLAGQTSLAQTAAILSCCNVLVTADSGVMHIAYAVGTPTVALFGAGIESKWAPKGPNHIVLNKHLPCSPCTRFGHTPKCRIGVKCLWDISVEEVQAAVQRLVIRKEKTCQR